MPVVTRRAARRVRKSASPAPVTPKRRRRVARRSASPSPVRKARPARRIRGKVVRKLFRSPPNTASRSRRRAIGIARMARRGANARRARAGPGARAMQALFKMPKGFLRRARKPRKACKKGHKRVGRVCKPKSHIPAVGSKAQVWKGLAKHTSGGLKKKDILRLTLTRAGKKVHRYVSAKKHQRGKSLRRKAGNTKALAAWRMAVRRAAGGKIPRKGTDAYKRAKALYAALMAGKRQSLSPVRARSPRRAPRRRTA